MKTLLQVALAFSFLLLSAFTAPQAAPKADSPQGKICFKVKNDTGSSVTLHTGKGTSPMNNGVQREFCLEEGDKLYVSDKGRPGKVLVTANAKADGKTFKLPDLM